MNNVASIERNNRNIKYVLKEIDASSTVEDPIKFKRVDGNIFEIKFSPEIVQWIQKAEGVNTMGREWKVSDWFLTSRTPGLSPGTTIFIHPINSYVRVYCSSTEEFKFILGFLREKYDNYVNQGWQTI